MQQCCCLMLLQTLELGIKMKIKNAMRNSRLDLILVAAIIFINRIIMRMEAVFGGCNLVAGMCIVWGWNLEHS